MSADDRVLVGLGHDGGGIPELNWAAREATSRGAPLHVLRACDVTEPVEAWLVAPRRVMVDELIDDAEQALGAALEHVRRRWPDLEVHGRVAEGAAAKLLVEGSRDAAVTVVGSRQLSTIGAMVLGSVSAAVVATARGPVVVVGRHLREPISDPAVVVGLDGFGRADELLGFAFEHASRHHRTLHAVACWNDDVLGVTPWPLAHHGAEAAAGWLAQTLSGWQQKHPEVRVRREIVHDHPVAGLVAASAGHDLLVVGSHARRPHVPSRLGSVSQGVLHHAHCPVAVLHPRGGA
ncbi:MAG TPA: universal stress protein [Jatrophihabitantaceae bacterium]|jgi:nucleotide-binding universal stress UspA family protein